VYVIIKFFWWFVFIGITRAIFARGIFAIMSSAGHGVWLVRLVREQKMVVVEWSLGCC